MGGKDQADSGAIAIDFTKLHQGASNRTRCRLLYIGTRSLQLAVMLLLREGEDGSRYYSRYVHVDGKGIESMHASMHGMSTYARTYVRVHACMFLLM